MKKRILFLLFLTATGFVIPVQTFSQVTVFYKAPRNLQFFARDSQDSSVVQFTGNLSTAGYDSVFLEVYKNNVLWKRKSSKFVYSAGVAPFSMSQKIHAELSEYNFKLYFKNFSGINTLIKSADSIACGDAYVISGQSNSHNTNDLATYINEFCRSFGVQTPNGNGDPYNPADTTWGLSKATNYMGAGWTGPYNVGVWGLYLQKQITDSTGIPTCFINGGRRGATIELNLRNNSNQTDLNTLYGKLLYRVQKSGLAENIKAIFWYQGEANGDASWMNYAANFQTLYNSWKENYPNFSKVFFFQVRHGCNGNLEGGSLREVQRQLAKTYPSIELVSTMGLPEHGVDDCHYGFQGYYELSVNLYRQVAKVFYTISNITDIGPPNIKAAYYTTPAKNEIGLIFNNSAIASWPADTLSQSMKNYFYLDGAFGNVSGGIVAGSILKLQLISPSNATKITYLPSKYNNGTSVIYEGPFIRNSRRIGALSFNNFPISNNPPLTLNLTCIPEGYYNLNLNRLNIRDTATVFLRNNFYPYQVRDSLRGVIDSVSFSGTFTFVNAPVGTYYIVVRTRNTVETWSSAGTMFVPDSSTNYNFTSSGSKAFGNNVLSLGDKWCIYSGDVNQNGSIDAEDLSLVDNDAFNFEEGYLATDVTGNNVTDASDLAIADNNAFNYVSLIRP